jgi:hypothetical protein
MDAVSVLAGGIGWSPWFKWDSSFDRRAISEQFQRRLLERVVPLESLPTVEAVPLNESSAKAREKEVKRVKINIAAQTAPCASANKGV